MSAALTKAGRWKMGGGLAVFAALGLPLWGEFREPGLLGWNIVLAVFLIALAVGAVALNRYLRAHIGEVGEARFDTRNDRSLEVEKQG